MNYKTLVEKRQDKTISDQVYSLYWRYLVFKNHYAVQMARAAENWNIYLPVDTEHGFGQYPSDVIASMIAQKRAPLTFNLAKPTCDQIASGLVQAPFDPTYYPINQEITKLTQVVQKAMYSDKEICNWGQAYFELVRAGCVIQGDIKMGITKEFHPLGNIALDSVLPNSVLYSPSWKTSIMKHCPRCFHEQWLEPQAAIEYYGNCKNADLIIPHLEMLRDTPVEYGGKTGAVPYAGEDGLSGPLTQFIHEYRMEMRKTKNTFIVTQHGDMQIPQELISTPGSVKDFLDQTFGFEKWDPDNIFEDEVPERVCIKSTIAPSVLGVDIIEEKKTEVQIGQIPFYSWSCDRVNGEPHGIIDQIKDAQRTVNYWNSLIQYKIQLEGGGRAKLVDKSKFESPEVAQDAIENCNDPTRIFPVKPGSMDEGGGPFKPVNISTGVPIEVYQHLDRIINQYWPLISKVTPASRGMQEHAGQSGYLYNLQKIQSDQMVYTIHYTLRQFWNQVYEGHLMQSALTYSKEGVQRVFYFNGGKKKIVLNERVEFPDGSVGIKNDMKTLKNIRHNIIISDQQSSPTKNMQDLQVMSEYFKSLQPLAAAMPASIGYTISAMTDKIDQFSEEDKENLSEIQGVELESSLAQLELKTLQTQIETEKARQALAEILQLAAMTPEQKAAQQQAQMQNQQNQAAGAGQPLPPAPIPQQAAAPALQGA
jgi:hypothetical protein